MRYTIRHITRFNYDTPISESVMETRMQPRSDGLQRCLHFMLMTSPGTRIMRYQDHDGNAVHHFDIPAHHARLTVTADALVECEPPRPLPPRLEPAAWEELDALAASGEHWEHLAPSRFARTSPALEEFAAEITLGRRDDPLTTLRWLMAEMSGRFAYSPKSTRVDSPIEEALAARRGVCQDFVHIFITLARSLGIPSRYVSGYLFRDATRGDRSADGATHAWVEALVPDIGWVGLDPTNNMVVEERHIRVAVGRDYADVPPTRGVYKGVTAVRSELAVAVQVGPVTSSLTPGDVVPFTPWTSRDASPSREEVAQQQQQQQQ
jgi:transglutaminase-like putative cysteine protease